MGAIQSFPKNLKPYLIFAFGLTIGSILIVLLARTKFLPPEVPLFYGEALGEAQIGKSMGLTIPSLISLLIIVVNLLISFIVRDEFLKRVLILASLATAIFSTITTIKIILLVGSF